jgi:nicotinate phosphoribosyltransferase
VMQDGMRLAPAPSLSSAADLCARELSRLPAGCLRLVNPHIYKVSISEGLNELRLRLMDQVQSRLS